MSIEYYYHCYDESIETLIGRINNNALLYDVHKSIEKENDIIIMHIIYRIVCTTSLYRKKDIKKYIWDRLESQCETFTTITGKEILKKDYQKGFDELFNYCWEQKFSKIENKHKAKQIGKIAYQNRPFLRKLYDSNFALSLFALLFFVLQVLIKESYWTLQIENVYSTGAIIAQTAGVIYVSLICAIQCKKIYIFPIASLIIMIAIAIYTVFNPPNPYMEWDLEYSSFVANDLTKCIIIMGFSYFLWFPIIYFNKERLKDFGMI